MPTIKCPESNPCISPDTPVTNFSTEAPDPNEFFSLRWPWVDPNNPVGDGPGPNIPPHVFDADGCQSECVSTVSQQAADLCAAAQAEQCLLHHSGSQVFCNSAQSCSTVCPDGSVFTYVQQAGTVCGPSQLAADEQAAALACALVQVFLQCPSCMCSFTPTTLPQPQLGVFYSVQFHAVNCLPGPLSWTVGTGTLPPGLTLNEGTGLLSGTPTTPGTFNFTIVLQTNAT